MTSSASTRPTTTATRWTTTAMARTRQARLPRSGNNDIGVVGVNWNAKILACKFLNAAGSGSDARRHRVLQLHRRAETARGEHPRHEQQLGGRPGRQSLRGLEAGDRCRRHRRNPQRRAPPAITASTRTCSRSTLPVSHRRASCPWRRPTSRTIGQASATMGSLASILQRPASPSSVPIRAALRLPERHEHGHAARGRRRGAAGVARSNAHRGQPEGAPDAERRRSASMGRHRGVGWPPQCVQGGERGRCDAAGWRSRQCGVGGEWRHGDRVVDLRQRLCGRGGAINGDRRGQPWGAGGGWNDGTPNTWPDWLEIDFSGAQTIDEIDVFTRAGQLRGARATRRPA